MSDLIKINNALAKADASINVANKLLAVDNDLPELIPYRKGDKWGFCDKNKRIVIECIYDSCDFFYEGFAAVSIDGQSYYIDKKNNFLNSYPLKRTERFSEGLAFIVNADDNGFFINTHGGVVIECESLINNGEFIYINHFRDGHVIIFDHYQNMNGDLKLINKNGKIVMTWFIGDGGWMEYSEGFILTKHTQTYDFGNWFENIGIFSFLSVDGHKKITGENYLADDKYKTSVFKDCPKHISGAKCFTEGLAPIQLRGKWGYIDYTGAFIIIDEKISDCGNFSCGLAPTKRWKENWGYIDRQGEMVLPPKYSFAGGFHEDLALVAIKNDAISYRIINKNGVEIIFIEDFSSEDESKIKCRQYFQNGIFQYVRKTDSKVCTIDKNGTQYWED